MPETATGGGKRDKPPKMESLASQDPDQPVVEKASLDPCPNCEGTGGVTTSLGDLVCPMCFGDGGFRVPHHPSQEEADWFASQLKTVEQCDRAMVLAAPEFRPDDIVPMRLLNALLDRRRELLRVDL